MQLPLAVIQLCPGARMLAAWCYAGFILAALGALLLVLSRPSKLLIGVLSAAGIVLALLVPFSPSTDPYAYALFAYKAFALHLSPYAASVLPVDRVTATLTNLFPGEATPVRVANYGPVFVGAYSLIVGPFGLISLKAMVLAERAFGACLMLICAFLCARLRAVAVQARIAFAARINEASHADAVAKKFGFGGGLVPGVDVYAYMTHPPRERWGRAWLERGKAECRLFKPV